MLSLFALPNLRLHNTCDPRTCNAYYRLLMSGDLRQCEACGAFWGRPQDLLDISQECWPVHGTLNNHRRRRGARAGDPAPGKLYLQNKSNAPTVPQAPYRASGLVQVLSFSDAGPMKVSPQARGPASEKLQRTKPRVGNVKRCDRR